MGTRYTFSGLYSSLELFLTGFNHEGGKGREGNYQYPCELVSTSGEVVGVQGLWVSRTGKPLLVSRFLGYIPLETRSKVSVEGVKPISPEKLPQEWREYFGKWGYKGSGVKPGTTHPVPLPPPIPPSVLSEGFGGVQVPPSLLEGNVPPLVETGKEKHKPQNKPKLPKGVKVRLNEGNR